jgi:ubiquinone/menaquinone biosynthesis C-methylase UbiE
LHCINISQEEINHGEKNVRFSNVKPHFHLMDARNLEFEDEYFDFVYGYAILHPLDYNRALDEMPSPKTGRENLVCRATRY